MSIFNYFSKRQRLNRLMVEAEGLLAEHDALRRSGHYTFLGGPEVAGALARVMEKIYQLNQELKD